MKRKDERLIEWIKSVPLDSPGSEFTANVMTFLEEEAILEEEMNVILGKYSKRDVLPKVRDGFSTKTMEALEDRLKVQVFEPLVPKKTGTVFVSLFVVGYIFLLLDALVLNTLYVSDESLFRLAWFKEALRIPTIVWISIFSLTVLLLLDLNFKRKENLTP